MQGIVNKTILKGIIEKKSMTKIKKELKEVHKVIISPKAFKLRYDAIKSRHNTIL